METEETYSAWYMLLILPWYVANRAFVFAQMLGDRIESQEELESIVSMEAERLGLDPSKIDPKYQTGESWVYKKNGQYVLELSGPFRTRAVVRHELYHILKDVDSEDGSLMHSLLYREPRAATYALFRIRL